MLKIFYFSKAMLLIFLCSALFISNSQSQIVEEIAFMPTHDTDIGTGHNNSDSGHKTQIRISGQVISDNASNHDAYFKFNIQDSITIPDGMKILMAKIMVSTTTNDGLGRFLAYHVENDNWDEKATIPVDQAPDAGVVYESHLDSCGFTGGNTTMLSLNVTKALLKELAAGDNMMTIKLDNVAESYYAAGAKDIVFKTTGWEAGWDPPRLHVYFGYEIDPVFSDIADFGTLDNFYTRINSGPYFRALFNEVGAWTVLEDEGDNRLVLTERTAPYSLTSGDSPSPGAYAVYNGESYADFDFSVDAKVNATKDGEVKAKTDFVLVFGFINNDNFSYVQFQAGEPGGFYTVTESSKALVGEENIIPAISDTAYHTYRLVRTGNSVTAYFDGVEYLVLEDAALGALGKIGIGSYNDIVYFDNFIQGTATVETNFDKLNTAITDATGKATNAVIGEEDGQYKQAVVDALNAAITTAQAVAGNAEADQATVDAAEKALLDAVSTFEESVNGVFKANLATAIEEAQKVADEAVEGPEAGQYYPDAKANFQTAINTAKAVLDNAESTQEDVNAAIDALAVAKETFDGQIRLVGIQAVDPQTCQFYPVPAENTLSIRSENTIQSITISTLTGQTVKAIQNINVNSFELDVKSIAQGVYFINLRFADDRVLSQKFMKK